MKVYSLPALFVIISGVFFQYYKAFGADDNGMSREGGSQLGSGPSAEFYKHVVVQPKIVSKRTKRNIAVGDSQSTVISVELNGSTHYVNLIPNSDLFGSTYFEKHQLPSGGYHVNNNSALVKSCFFKGHIQGIPTSWVALSTCDGISGVIYDGKELHYIEKSGLGKGLHYVYSHSDLKPRNLTCGFSANENVFDVSPYLAHSRFRRDSGGIKGPYNSNQKSRFVELVLVVDNTEFKNFGADESKIYKRCKDIANIMNALYTPLNIFIALVGVVVWSESDEITLDKKGDATLTQFLLYRKNKLLQEHPNDNAQLLTGITFDGGVVGKALKGPICTSEFSGGVNMDHSAVVGLVATTVAHELGHNFGMEHDNDECHCEKDRCIMAASSSSISPTVWSSCSLEYLALSFEHGMDYCLRNKPTKLFGPECGNNFVEPGEECDCGMKEHCDNHCCNATTCMLFPNATCATGACCDLNTCQPKKAASVCREIEHECDLPEYCSGQSEYCPNNFHKQDGSVCKNGEAYCYGGTCHTHTDQCRLLWGPSGNNSDIKCYKQNDKGNRHGNCGHFRSNQTYLKCAPENIECGMLHCVHLNERLEFGIESVAVLSHSFIKQNGKVLPCRNALVDLGLDQMDPGLVPNGAKCGEDKMCVNQQCVLVGSVIRTTCPHNCSGNGVCNDQIHCHCRVGFAPPYCDIPGPGGSIDSGPASNPNALGPFVIALYVIFLGIVPLVVILLCCFYQLKTGYLFPRKSKKENDQGSNKRSQSSRLHVNHPGLISKCDITGPQEARVPDLHSSLLPILPSDDNSNHPTFSTKGYSLSPLTKTENNDDPTPYSAIYTNMVQLKDVETNNTFKKSLPSENCIIKDDLQSAQTVTYVLSSNDSSFCSTHQPSEDGDDVVKLPETKVSTASPSGTLSRLKKLLAGSYKNRSDLNTSPLNKPRNVADKKLKIDRESLRNINISNPIPQKEIELGKQVELVPIVTTSSPINSPNLVVSRESTQRRIENRMSWTSGSAHSGTSSGIIPRSESAKTDCSSPKRFHSLKSKRPQSINVTRPKSPPPRPPDPVLPPNLYQNVLGIRENEYCYDDCLNTLEGNIYATIDEETPTEFPAILYSTPNKSKSSNLSKSASGSENGGLLSEILTELQSRGDTQPVLYSNIPQQSPVPAATPYINTSSVSVKRAVFESPAVKNATKEPPQGGKIMKPEVSKDSSLTFPINCDDDANANNSAQPTENSTVAVKIEPTIETKRISPTKRDQPSKIKPATKITSTKKSPSPNSTKTSAQTKITANNKAKSPSIVAAQSKLAAESTKQPTKIIIANSTGRSKVKGETTGNTTKSGQSKTTMNSKPAPKVSTKIQDRSKINSSKSPAQVTKNVKEPSKRPNSTNQKTQKT